MKIMKQYGIYLILILAAILYLSFAFHDTLSPDEAHYAWQAKSIFEEPSNLNEKLRDYDVVVPFTIIIFDMFMPQEIASRLVGVIFGILGVLLVYLVGRELKDENVGLISALFLAISPWYWMLSDRILFDVPLTTIALFNIYLLIRFQRTKEMRFLGLSVFSFVLLLLTKAVGIMFLPMNLILILSAYYPFKKIQTKKMLTIIISCLLLLIIPVLIYFQMISHYFTRYFSFERILENYLVINNLYNILLGYIPNQVFILLYILSLLLVGFLIYQIINNKSQRSIYLILTLWIFSVFSFRLFFGGHVIIRYVLPALPAIILFLVILTHDLYQIILKQKIIKKKYLNSIVLLSIILMACFSLVQGYQMNKFTSYSKTGFREAGVWLKENVNSEDSIIYSGNPNQIRYNSGFGYQNNGGIIWTRHPSIGIPKKSSQIESFNKTSIYLQIDFREKYQPNWVRPNITNAKIISELGFEPVKVVYKNQPFYMAPPTKDKNEFLEFFNITPYTIHPGKNKIFPPNIEAYSGISDDGEYLEELGFTKADSLMDYIRFAMTFDDTFIEQPVIIIFKKTSY